MDRIEIVKAVSSEIIEKEGKKYIPCPVALKIAEALNVPQSEVGKICDEMKVKIMNCQLGCF